MPRLDAVSATSRSSAARVLAGNRSLRPQSRTRTSSLAKRRSSPRAATRAEPHQEGRLRCAGRSQFSSENAYAVTTRTPAVRAARNVAATP